MWRKSELLHPATVIAGLALFVSLGGVTYAAATIGTKQLKNGAVTRAKIKNRAVSPSKLANRAVTNAKLATNAVTPAKLRGRAVTVGKIADGAVQPANLQDGAVTEAKLGSGAVTAGKLGAGAVGAAALADGAVTAAKLAPGTAIGGRGSIAAFHRSLADGGAATLATLPGVGELKTACVNGRASSQFFNQSGVAVDVVVLRTIDGASPDLETASVPAGGDATAINAAGTGDQEVTWRVGFTDAQGAERVMTAQLSNVARTPACVVMGQVTTSG